jgi:hypothetical protein
MKGKTKNKSRESIDSRHGFFFWIERERNGWMEEMGCMMLASAAKNCNGNKL